jgi:hypothetical protein
MLRPQHRETDHLRESVIARRTKSDEAIQIRNSIGPRRWIASPLRGSQ